MTGKLIIYVGCQYDKTKEKYEISNVVGFKHIMRNDRPYIEVKTTSRKYYFLTHITTISEFKMGE